MLKTIYMYIVFGTYTVYTSFIFSLYICELCEENLIFLRTLQISANESTTLHFEAAINGNEIEIFEMLLTAEKRVDIMGLTSKKNSVLTLAMKYNEYDFAEYLFNNHYILLNI